jgi:hypothetical protein
VTAVMLLSRTGAGLGLAQVNREQWFPHVRRSAVGLRSTGSGQRKRQWCAGVGRLAFGADGGGVEGIALLAACMTLLNGFERCGRPILLPEKTPAQERTRCDGNTGHSYHHDEQVMLSFGKAQLSRHGRSAREMG